MREAIVIGAGPAGSTAARCLARRGVEVTLVDAGRLPRDKVCGECLSALGLATLGAVGLGDVLREARPIELVAASVYPTRGRPLTLPLPRPMAGITRWTMDRLLLDSAVSAGVTVLEKSRATRVEPGDRPTVHVRGPDGERTLTADAVFLADGKGTLPGAATTPTPRPTGDLGVKAHFRGVELPADQIALFGVRGHYGGIAPVSDIGNPPAPTATRRVAAGDVLWNLAFAVPADRVARHAGSFDSLLDVMKGENARLAHALRDATVAGGWLASPLPRFAPRPAEGWPPGVIPIGNAAAALEPVGGEGMGLAIASAAMAVEHVLAGGSTDALQAKYVRLWRRRRLACRAIAQLVSRPAVAVPAIALARCLPAVGAAGAWLAGKRSNGIGFADGRPAVS